MNDHIDPDKVRELIKKWRGTTNQTMHRVNLVYEVAADDLESLLTPSLLTLADLIEEGHNPADYIFRWMKTEDGIELLIMENDECVYTLNSRGYRFGRDFHEVTPLPDLPRLVWPASEPEAAEGTPTPEVTPKVLLTEEDYREAVAVDMARTRAAMKTEWGVKDTWGDVVWFIPTDYVDMDDEGAKRMAEEYAADNEGFQLVHRYVTDVINDV